MALTEIKLPEVGEGVTEGELVKWLVKAGDVISQDQIIAEVLTDKATVEVPCPVAGTVKELKAKPGAMIPIGSTLLTLETGAGSASVAKEVKHEAPKAVPVTSKPQVAKATEPVVEKKLVELPPADLNVLATPSTRKMARELGVDINQVKGTGLAGRVTLDDVVAAGGGARKTVVGGAPRLGFQSTNANLEERVALKGIRRKIAEKMQLAKQIVPHFTLMDEAKVTELVKMKESVKAKAEELGIKVTYMPFVMKALVATCREYPEVNASIDDEKAEIVYKKYFNIGFAADTPQGLVVPVLKNAENKSIIELSAEIFELGKKARDGKLALDEMKGASITITNIGAIGGTYATPIINHPEVAILGMYKIQEKPVVVNGELVVEKFMNFTLTADHRLIDGAVAAKFLNSFIKRIENPGLLMLDMI